MPDREKVITHFKDAIEASGDNNKWRFVRVDVINDALELLKGQEPVMPVLVPKGHGAGVGYDCGTCGTELVVLRGTIDIKIVHEQMRFCRMCGRAVKWDA